MRAIRPLLSLLAGAVLYYVAVVFVGGVLAAVTIPASSFTWFGSEHREARLALINLLTWAVPVCLLVGAGAYGVQRANARAGPWVPFGLVVGMVVACVYWLLVFHFAVVGAGTNGWSFSQSLSSAVVVPWWAVSNVAAPWLGAALGLWFAHRPHAGRNVVA